MPRPVAYWIRDDLLRINDYICQTCGQELDRSVADNGNNQNSPCVSRIIRGSDDTSNLIVMCRKCVQAKTRIGDMSPYAGDLQLIRRRINDELRRLGKAFNPAYATSDAEWLAALKSGEKIVYPAAEVEVVIIKPTAIEDIDALTAPVVKPLTEEEIMQRRLREEKSKPDEEYYKQLDEAMKTKQEEVSANRPKVIGGVASEMDGD